MNGTPDYQRMYQGNDKVNGDFYIDEDIYNDRIDMIANPKIDWILNVCEQEKLNPQMWLDVGSGGGEIIYALREKGIHGIGIESDLLEYSFSKGKGVDVRNLRVDFKNEEVAALIHQADLISFFNVLEHVPDPQKFIDYIHDNMKSGTVLVCEVPRHPSLASYANVTGRDFSYRHIVPPIHLTVFSERGLEHILADRFIVLGKWCFGQGYVDVINNALLWSKEEKGKLYERVINISNEVQEVIDACGLADQVMVVVKKK